MTICCPSCGPKPNGGVYCPDCGEVLLHGTSAQEGDMMDTMTDTRIVGMRWTSNTPDGFLVADAQLHQLGDQRPYFSVSGELWDSEGWYRNGQDARCREGGMLHDRILETFPQLAPLVSLHLSDEDGVPMYAVENGWYWYNRDRAACAKLLRVELEKLPAGLNLEEFEEYVDEQRPRWKREADEARAYLESVQV